MRIKDKLQEFARSFLFLIMYVPPYVEEQRTERKEKCKRTYKQFNLMFCHKRLPPCMCKIVSLIIACAVVMVQPCFLVNALASLVTPEGIVVPSVDTTTFDYDAFRVDTYRAALNNSGLLSQNVDTFTFMGALQTAYQSAGLIVDGSPYKDEYEMKIQFIKDNNGLPDGLDGFDMNIYFVTVEYADMTIGFYVNEAGEKIGSACVQLKDKFNEVCQGVYSTLKTYTNQVTNKVERWLYGDCSYSDFGQNCNLTLGGMTHVMYRMSNMYYLALYYEYWVSQSNLKGNTICLVDGYGGLLFIGTDNSNTFTTTLHRWSSDGSFQYDITHRLTNYYKGYYWTYILDDVPNLDYVPFSNVFELSSCYGSSVPDGNITQEWVENYIDTLPDATIDGFELPEQPKVNFNDAVTPASSSAFEYTSPTDTSYSQDGIDDYVTDCDALAPDADGAYTIPRTFPDTAPFPSYGEDDNPYVIPGDIIIPGESDIPDNPDLPNTGDITDNPDIPNTGEDTDVDTPTTGEDTDVDNPDISGEETDSDTDTDLDIPSAVGTMSLMDRFPFCVPHDLIEGIKLFNAEPKTPEWSWVLKVDGTPIEYTWTISLEKFENVAKLCRTLLTILFVWGLAKATREVIKG